MTIGVEREQVMLQAEGEGHAAVLRTAWTFIESLAHPDRDTYFGVLVTPESLHTWRHDLTAEVVADLQSRGMTSRPDYPIDGVAFVRLPPDPGVIVKVVGATQLPPSTTILALIRRSDMPSLPEFGGWRVHAYGPAGAISQEHLDAWPIPNHA